MPQQAIIAIASRCSNRSTSPEVVLLRKAIDTQSQNPQSDVPVIGLHGAL